MQYTRNYDFATGTTIVADQVDQEFNSIAGVINGNVDSDNITDAAVIEDKIATNAVTTTKIEDSAVTVAKIEDSAVTVAKTDTAVTGKPMNPRIWTLKNNANWGGTGGGEKTLASSWWFINWDDYIITGKTAKWRWVVFIEQSTSTTDTLLAKLKLSDGATNICQVYNNTDSYGTVLKTESSTRWIVRSIEKDIRSGVEMGWHTIHDTSTVTPNITISNAYIEIYWV